MKIKTDYVSNSSSTSFLLIKKGEFTKESFCKAVGISESSPLIQMIYHFFDSLNESIDRREPIENLHELESNRSIPYFPEEAIEKAKNALERGRQIIVGGLSSDGPLSVGFLCVEAFEIDSEDFYLSAVDNYW